MLPDCLNPDPFQTKECHFQQPVFRPGARYTGQTDLQVDSLSFLTLINEVESHLVRGLKGFRGLCFKGTPEKAQKPYPLGQHIPI